MNEKIGIVLLNLGGPDSLDAVRPFLYNLFNDPDIIDFPGSFLFRSGLAKLISSLRYKGIQEQYEEIGGKSPLKDTTLGQAKMLEERLEKRFPVKVVVAMRYWHPFTEEAIDELEKEGIKKVILLPMYPQFSTSTTGSSVNEWKKHLKKRGIEDIEWTLIENYHDFPPFHDAVIERIHEGLEKFDEANRDDVFLMFSAHGTPMKLVREGDPYSKQIAATVEAVMKRIEVPNKHTLCWQSKVGPQKWLTPSTPDTIDRLAEEGEKKILAIPVAFTQDHLETLFEVAIEFGHLAKEAGIEEFHVTEGMNFSEKFIDALEQLVLQEVEVVAKATA